MYGPPPTYRAPPACTAHVAHRSHVLGNTTGQLPLSGHDPLRGHRRPPSATRRRGRHHTPPDRTDGRESPRADARQRARGRRRDAPAARPPRAVHGRCARSRRRPPRPPWPTRSRCAATARWCRWPEETASAARCRRSVPRSCAAPQPLAEAAASTAFIRTKMPASSEVVDSSINSSTACDTQQSQARIREVVGNSDADAGAGARAALEGLADRTVRAADRSDREQHRHH